LVEFDEPTLWVAEVRRPAPVEVLRAGDGLDRDASQIRACGIDVIDREGDMVIARGAM